jgi:hypothetical protein
LPQAGNVLRRRRTRHISTAALLEKQHDKDYDAKGVFFGGVAEQHPQKQGLKPRFKT